MTHLTHWLLLAVFAFTGSTLAAEPTAVHASAVHASAVQASDEKARIEGLITSVEKAKGLVFIRNGSEHDGAAAAAHLRMKWKRAGSRVRTAEDFIKVCASKSSLSGRVYQIRFANGHLLDSADYFNAQLRRIDAASRARLVRASASKSG